MRSAQRPAALAALLLVLAAALTARGDRGTPAPPHPTRLRALLVGGGPDPSHNQVAIESNVRYVRRLLPPDTPARVLFADGDPKTRDVQYEDQDSHEHYRATQIAGLDGPARRRSIDAAFAHLKDQRDPVLLYFTGHGSPDRGSEYTNNQYDLWGGDGLSVRGLAAQMATLPRETPVVLVMVQCFSGAFGNLLFQGGDPGGALTDRDFCGFFASVPTRPAAGCTPEVNEADYHDFTGYFFAALGGVDRLGRPTSGADYNGDGKVGMDEAFAYALIHDVSIDTPVCTSDVFLRRFVPMADRDVFRTPYADARAWATPAQAAALDALSSQLQLRGEDRFVRAYARFVDVETNRRANEQDGPYVARVIRLVRVAKTVVLSHTLAGGHDLMLQARFERLRRAESRNPLRPAA